MMMPCKEENPGLRVDYKAIGVLVFVLFISQTTFPQVPINGFCKYQEFHGSPNCNSLIALNYNNDSYTDLMLYNHDSRKIYSIPGKSNGKFGRPEVHSVPYLISGIQNLIEQNKRIKRYAFTSRQSRRVGILAFSSYGRPYVTSSIKFNSYPENICTADIDHSGKDAMLISGSAFNGLTVIYQSAFGLKKEKIIQQTSFSQAIFADLSNDGFGDIAAFNVIDNSLMFFYNDGTGKFNMVRTFIMDEPIHCLQSVDMNLDNYADLLFVKGNSIVIMYGDFASSYDKVVTIPTKYYPDEIITGDFNRDGKIDLAYVNKNKGILSVIFAKGEYSFYPETIYMQKKGLVDLIPYYSKFVNAIVSVSDSGSIYSISNLATINMSASIVTSAKPVAVNFFDHGNNGIIDLCYIDSLTSSLNLIVRNNAGVPKSLFSYMLNEVHSKIVIDNTKPKIKTFYCFTPGRRLIEILKIDFNENVVERYSLYSPGNILDMKILNEGGEADKIYVAYSKSGKLGMDVFEFHDYRYTGTNYEDVASNVFKAAISFYKFPMMYYWAKGKGMLNFYSVTFSGKPEVKYTGISLPPADEKNVVLFTGDLLNKVSDASISFYPEGQKSDAVVYYGNNHIVWKSKNLPGYFNVGNANQLYFGQTKFSGVKKLCVYLPTQNIIARLDFINRGKEFVVSKLAEANNVQSFFIKNMNFSKYHLVYINKKTDCIEIEEL